MIPTPAEWKVERLPLGAVMYPPGGPGIGSISYRERSRPLLRLGVLVRDILRQTPHWITSSVGPGERLETVEGEPAALVTVQGTHRGEPAQRDLGFVFGDDFYSSIGGLCLKESFRHTMTEIVRELTRQDTHALGIRRRAFEYDPPARWQPVPLTGFGVDWLAPDYPRDLTNLTVYAASPHSLVKRASVDTMIEPWMQGGGTLRSRRQVAEIQRGELSGTLEEVALTSPSGAQRTCRAVVLQDSRYVYPMELWSPALTGYHIEILDEVLRSVRAVPPPGGSEAVLVAVNQWLE